MIKHSRILVLPPEIYQKIAAGEVVERPVSAVKELVENSLDAESTEIKVELIEGGKKLIRVTDNGSGMTGDDALVCFERHSTSKIKREDDLGHISTLGFRGEALPSISTVSRIKLKTSAGDGGQGILIEREGEEVLRTMEISYPHGTSVEVGDLFFNLPARKKFLKSERAELSLMTNYLTTVALAHPGVRLSLYHGNREIFNHPPVSSLKERIFQVYGRSVLERLLEVDFTDNETRLYGFSSCPPSGRRDRKHQFFYVNGRPVKDKVLIAALNQAYKPFLEKEYSPEAFLFIEIPHSEVDVNVHPAKTEVRFRDSAAIYRLINRSIEHAVLKEMGLKEIYPAESESLPDFKIEELKDPTIFSVHKKKEDTRELFYPPELFQKLLGDDKEYPQVLGQYQDMYIIAWDEEGLLVIDQHNAHERVLYEQYLEIDKKEQWPRKLTLLPVLIELSAAQEINYENNRGLLEKAGFRVEPMGGRSYALKEYPDIFQEKEATEVFLALIEEVGKGKVVDKKEKVLATLACKTAVKAHEHLSREKMIYLVDELFKTTNPSLCPHGRPIVVKLGKKEIERGLGRR